jgi:hypothetical protein
MSNQIVICIEKPYIPHHIIYHSCILVTHVTNNQVFRVFRMSWSCLFTTNEISRMTLNPLFFLKNERNFLFHCINSIYATRYNVP